MKSPLGADALNQIFLEARTRNSWTDRPLTDEDIHRIYELMKFGPTTANTNPARFVWIRSPEAKARLEPLLAEGNKAKVMEAPATVIVAHDEAFPLLMPKLFPHMPEAQHWFPGDRAKMEAHRSGTLQGAYLMIAARALGFDCGPMAGFDNAGVDAEFLAGTTWKSNFICSIGEGADKNLFPRLPRLAFDEANRIL